VINVEETKAKAPRWTKALGFTIPVLADLKQGRDRVGAGGRAARPAARPDPDRVKHRHRPRGIIRFYRCSIPPTSTPG
jgi:hypothetical protein